MKQLLCLFGILSFSALSAQETFTFPHDDIKQFSMYGNAYKNLAAQAMGSHEFEIWRSSLSGPRWRGHLPAPWMYGGY